ncbi:MAG TPA: PAS domain-containing sensor histidine kinase [Longimicrobium sp.]|jgi:PAS domain S-box-containing protein|uniref:PAS domain-containing sensor histidine kinase n=1 Tax=Longimicrobium sp. TaxID=2029185 RepID=UPI002EDB49E1
MPHRTRPRASALPGRDELYRLLVENVTDYAIILLSPEGRVTTWTEGAGRMFGYDEEEILGQPLAVFFPPDDADRDAPVRDLHTAIRDGRCETVAWRVRRDGSRLWASVVLTAIHDAAGKLIGLGQITRDLTERKEVAERYEESRQRYRSLFDNNPDGVCSFDLDGTLRTANPAAESLIGYDADDLRSATFWSLVSPDDRERMRGLFGRTAAGEPQGAETVLVHQNGRRVDVRVTLVPIVVGGGILGVYCIAEDITERRRAAAERDSLLLRERIARAEAEAANRAKTDFLAVVSHELRTPLNAIVNFSELLLDGEAGALSDLQRKHLDRIRGNSGQLQGMIEDVLGYTRLDSGESGITLERVDLCAVVNEVAREFAGTLGRRGVEFQVIAEEDACAETDPRRCRELLRAVLSNAAKFTESGRVEVSVRSEPGWVAVAVADTGIGIDESHLEKIWDPFWQAEHPLIRRAGGSGLGLSIARRLAGLLGGDIHAASTPGDGSTFTVRLPLAQ